MNGLEAQISSIFRRFQRKERDLKLLAQYRHPHFSSLKMAKVREFHHYFLSILCLMECGLRSNCLRKTDRPCLYDLSGQVWAPACCALVVGFGFAETGVHVYLRRRDVEPIEGYRRVDRDRIALHGAY